MEDENAVVPVRKSLREVVAALRRMPKPAVEKREPIERAASQTRSITRRARSLFLMKINRHYSGIAAIRFSLDCEA